MQIAYIAGPYSSRWGVLGRLWNIYKARKVAIRWWRWGYAVICPHSNTALFDKYAPDDVWLAGDLEFIARCDVVVLMTGWEKSAGATKEKAAAEMFIARRFKIKILSEDRTQ